MGSGLRSKRRRYRSSDARNASSARMRSLESRFVGSSTAGPPPGRSGVERSAAWRRNVGKGARLEHPCKRPPGTESGDDLLFQREHREQALLQGVELVSGARLDHLARLVLGEELAHQLLVEGVPGLHGGELADDGHPDQGEVAERVEDLVADELVREAEPFGVEDVEVVHHHRVLERAAAGEARLVEALYVALEAKRPGPGDVLLERLLVDLEAEALIGDQRVAEVDGVVDRELPPRRRKTG